MSERDNRVKAFEKLMRGGLSSTDVFCLKNQLMAMGFFTAPASTKYHGNYEGGLFDHSFAVTSSLLSLTKRMGLNWKRKASPYIVGMLHDLCKCDSYIHNPDGTYSYNPGILLPGHGDKSVILAQKIVDLTDEEMACIRWHMGAFDDEDIEMGFTEVLTIIFIVLKLLGVITWAWWVCLLPEILAGVLYVVIVVAQLVAIHKTSKSIKKHFDEF